MKTHPIMIPAHGMEDVKAGAIFQAADGACLIETGISQSADNLASALEFVRRRWPNAYLGEAERCESPPPAALSDLFALAVSLNSEQFAVTVEFCGRMQRVEISVFTGKPFTDPTPSCWHSFCLNHYFIQEPPEPEARIQRAIDWLNDQHQTFLQQTTQG